MAATHLSAHSTLESILSLKSSLCFLGFQLISEFFSCWDKNLLSSNTGNIEKSHGHKRHPQGGCKGTILPKSRATPKDKRKKERQFPWELTTVNKILATNGLQSTFMSGHNSGCLIPWFSWRGVGVMLVLQSFGFGTSCVLIFLFSFSYIFDIGEPITCMLQTDRKPNQVLRTENEANKKAIAVPGTKKGSITNGYPQTTFTGVWIWKGKNNLKFYLPFLGLLEIQES